MRMRATCSITRAPSLIRRSRIVANWVNGVSDGLSVKEIETVHRVVTALRKKNWGEEMNLTSAGSR
jgi:hypothetical protein